MAIRVLLLVCWAAGTVPAHDPGERAKAAAFVRLLGDAKLGTVAERSLLALGDDAVPALEAALLDSASPVRAQAAAVLGRLGAKESLVRALDDPDPAVREQARRALAGLGVVAVAALDESARDGGAVQRTAAVRALAGMGAGARDASPRLVAFLRDPDPAVRAEAADALGRIGARDAVPDLRRLLAGADARADLREASFRSLDAIRPDGWDAVAELRGLWKDRDPLVRAFAARELARREVADAVPALVLGLNDLSHLVRRESALALARVAPASDEVLALLEAGVRDRLLLSPAVAAEALGLLGERGRAALEEAARSGDADLAAAARAALDAQGVR